jgi:hypothetical protein
MVDAIEGFHSSKLFSMFRRLHNVCRIYIPYPREKGPMGSAPYIGFKLGGGPIFQVSVSQLDAKERPSKVPRDLQNSIVGSSRCTRG